MPARTGPSPYGPIGLAVLLGAIVLLGPFLALGLGPRLVTSPAVPTGVPRPGPRSDSDPSTATTVVQFLETGLRSGTSWWVELGGVNQSGWGTTNSFFEPAGTYAYHVGAAGYTVSPSSGSLTLSGQVIVNVSVTFQIIWPGPYRVTFVASGLPSGTNWSVELNGITNRTDLASFGIGGLAPGVYPYHVLSVGSLSPTPAYGNVTIGALNATVDVTFAAPPPPAPHVGPFTLTWGWGFAAFALAVWILWVGYRIAGGIRDYLQEATPGPTPSHRKTLNSVKLAGHLALLALPAVAAVAIALSPELFSAGPWVYGIFLLLLVGLFTMRDVGGFHTQTGWGVYVDWEPPPPAPCWRCGLLNAADATTCTGCGASLGG